MDADSTIDKVLGSAGSGDNVNFELGDNTDGNLMIESGSGQEIENAPIQNNLETEGKARLVYSKLIPPSQPK